MGHGLEFFQRLISEEFAFPFNQLLPFLSVEHASYGREWNFDVEAGLGDPGKLIEFPGLRDECLPERMFRFRQLKPGHQVHGPLGLDLTNHEFIEVLFAAVGLDGLANDGGSVVIGAEIGPTANQDGGQNGKESTHLSLQVRERVPVTMSGYCTGAIDLDSDGGRRT